MKFGLDRVMIAAHRGVASGNIPCNSIPAYMAALRMGADIVELDVSRSEDGVLYMFHPGMEPVFLKSERLISQMHSSEVDRLYLRNQDSTPTQYRVPRLIEAFELIRGRAYINIDKFWTCPAEIAKLVRELGMQDQVLIKTGAKEENYKKVEEAAPDLPYMVIARDNDDFTETLLRRNLRYVGVETLFDAETSPLAQAEYIGDLKKHGLIAWVNAIVYNYKDVLAAGHTDDIAVSESEDQAWGWMIEKGFSVIQTDWPAQLNAYLKAIGKR